MHRLRLAWLVTSLAAAACGGTTTFQGAMASPIMGTPPPQKPPVVEAKPAKLTKPANGGRK